MWSVCLSTPPLSLTERQKKDFSGSQTSTSFAFGGNLFKKKNSVSGNATVFQLLQFQYQEEHELCHCNEEQATDARNVRARPIAAASARSVPKAHKLLVLDALACWCCSIAGTTTDPAKSCILTQLGDFSARECVNPSNTEGDDTTVIIPSLVV